MICPYCKKTLPDQAQFCAHCGNSLRKKKSSGKKKFVTLLIGFVGLLAIAAFLLHGRGEGLPGVKDAVNSVGNGLPGKSSEVISLSQNDANIVSDEKYIYYCSENNVGTIYRLDKKTHQMDLMCESEVNPGPINGEYAVVNPDAITLCGDDLYFSLRSISTDFATEYFRMPKEGGSAEFLFLLPRSYMVADKNKIYFLFREEKKIGVYDTKKGGLPNFVSISDQPGLLGGNKAPFDVSDGKVYYVGDGGDKLIYNLYKTDVKSGKTENLTNNSGKEISEIQSGILVGNDFYYDTPFFNTIQLVRKLNLKTGKNMILSGLKGSDLFLSYYDGKIIVPNDEDGKYALLSLNDPSKREACYAGETYETDNSLDNLVNSMFGEPTEEVKKETKREKLVSQRDGFVFTAYQGKDLNTWETFEWSLSNEDYKPLSSLSNQDAIKKAAQIMVQHKGLDCSQGILPTEQ